LNFNPNIHLTKLLLRLMHLNRLRDLMSSASGKKGNEFIDLLFEKPEISFEICLEDRSRIPKTGPFIVVSNHPFGGLVDLILLRGFSDIHPDFKIFSIRILNKFGGLDEFLLPGTAFSLVGSHRSTPDQLLKVARYLREGGCLGIFPS